MDLCQLLIKTARKFHDLSRNKESTSVCNLISLLFTSDATFDRNMPETCFKCLINPFYNFYQMFCLDEAKTDI